MSNKLVRDTSYFSASIMLDTEINAPTVVYLSTKVRGDAWYPNGYTFRVFDDDDNDINFQSYSDDENRLKFGITDKKYHGKRVNLIVVPK